MEYIRQFLQLIANVLRFHKLKVLILLVFTLFFGLILFPFSDFSDLVATEIAERSGNQVYVQFDDLGISLIPQPGVEMSNVIVETPALPPLKADSLSVAPSIPALLAFKNGISVYAKGLFNGSVSLSLKDGEKLAQGDNHQQVVSVDASQVDLNSLSKFLEKQYPFPLDLKGTLALETNISVDPQLSVQPKGPLDLEIKQLIVPAYNLQTPLGELPTPELKFESIGLKGKLQDGNLVIDQGSLGDSKDEVSGKITGQVTLQMRRIGAQIAPDFGPYDLKVELNIQNSAQKKMGLFLMVLDQYKSSVPTGTRYAFRMTGRKFMADQPEFKPAQ